MLSSSVWSIQQSSDIVPTGDDNYDYVGDNIHDSHDEEIE